MAVRDVIFIGESSVSESPSGKGDVFLSVEKNGDRSFIRWFCYFGSGEHDPSASTGWHPNSGNVIVEGGLDLLDRIDPVVSVGVDGIFLGIDRLKILRWYRYIGMGEISPFAPGTQTFFRFGFHPNSDRRIGNGWNGKHITAYPLFGPEQIGAHQIFVVQAADDEGKLSWYGYMGNGEDDFLASTRWHPKSHHITSRFIGNGWNGFQFLVAGGGVHFAVPQSGPDKGNLLYFRYIGKGDGDVSGATGWAQNSGNPIGNGWGGFRYLFGPVILAARVEQDYMLLSITAFFGFLIILDKVRAM